MNEIAKKQVIKIEFLNRTLLFLNSNIPDMNKKIKIVIKGKYIYIFLSPKLANLEVLYPLLINPQFKKYLAIIVVNKAYFIIYWG